MIINSLEEELIENRMQLEAELKDAKLLQNISMELIREDNTQILFEKIMDAATQVMHSEYASMQMLHSDPVKGDKLQLLAYRGFNPYAVKFWEWVYAEDAGSTCGQALRTGQRVIVANVKDSDFMQGTEDLATYLQTGINAVQTTPLYSRGGRLLGMISTHWSKPYEPSERELRLLDVVARQASDLIERKQYEEKIKWDKEKAEILYEVTEELLKSDRPQEIVEKVCARVMKFLKCDVFLNYLIDEEYRKLYLNACCGIPEEKIKEMEWLDFGANFSGCVARDGCSIVAEDLQSTEDIRANLIKSFGIRAYACYPLMEQNKIIGTLSFGTRSKDTFNEDELALMNIVANQVSIAMNRIRTEQLIIKAENEKSHALEKALEMKDEFLSLISHEFRTPINVIYTAIQAMNLMYEKEMPDKVRSYLKTIKQNTFRQLRLVNNLLDITRANSGHMKVNRKNCDIVFLTKSISESVYQYASQKGVEITFLSSLKKKVIGIDDEKYERIILNLLSNAIKFTPRGKSIIVKLRSIKNSICVEVTDNGIGIPPDKLNVIFERFGQVDSSLSRQAEGTGIGLSLVKNFVEALGGSISVKSKVGKGSNFTIQLPDDTILEEENENQGGDLLDTRLVHVTHVEFSDIYL
jgi:signal transduction histidine kinase